MILRSIKKIFVVLSVVMIVSGFPALLFAQESSGIIINETDIDDYPEVNLYISFKEGSELGALDLKQEDFSVFENSEEVQDILAERIAVISDPIGVVLVIDTSGSMKGKPIEDAKSAALVFMNEMRKVDEFAIVGFADEVTTYSNFTSDRQKLAESIGQINAEGETSLFDGLYISLNQFKERQDLQYKYAIVLSDGTDTVSKLSTQDVIIKAQTDKITIYSISLMSYDYNPTDLRNISSSTNGELLIAADSGQLKELYGIISRKIRNQYRISYISLWPNTEIIDVEVSIEKSGLSGSKGTDYENPYYAPAPTEIIKSSRSPFLYLFDRWWVKYTIYGAIFLGITLFLYILVMIIIPRKKVLKGKTEIYGYKPAEMNIEDIIKERKGKIRFFDRIVIQISRLSRKRGFGDVFEIRLQRAGMSISSSEFITIHIISIIVISLGVYFLTGSYLLTFLILAAIVLLPFLILNLRMAQRLRKFHDQLPDTLQLISGSLKAGYSFNQALSMIVEETIPPTSDEFRRGLSEIRMGLQETEAVENMAKRIGSEHFDWVVMSVNIQREVGGNLAEVMEIIANTIRERDTVMRQIKALTAEGRLSAYILIGLPIVLAIALSFLNREYVSLLYTSIIGLIMIGIAVILMVIGIIWIIKIIRVEY
ncbi:MAG: VWA domain-containing protein [Actinomycetota bacterium]|nr:MAG: VWA domain-containing protein [Actinomycetota bacterium]